MTELSSLVAPVSDIARHAGEAILAIYQKDFKATTKKDGSPVTKADIASHDILISELKRLLPGVPLLSEESEDIPYTDRSSWSVYWLVDPLDGTKEFVKRSDEFTINIALMEANLPVFGLVYTPILNRIHWGFQNGWAWCAQNGNRRRINTLQYKGGRACVAASRSHGQRRLVEYLKILQRTEGDYDLRLMGSAVKICLVAEGSAHLYPRFGPTGEWDTAAADIILHEAGGQLLQHSMQELKYNKQSLINPSFFACCAGTYDWSALLTSDLFGVNRAE
jgi:3'(2'), 5'-bisphosphate nucleotidase